MEEKEERVLHDLVVDKYYEYIKTHGYEPSKSAFTEFCLDEEGNAINWKGAFGKIEQVRKATFERYDDCGNYVFNEKSFDEGYADRLEEEIKDYKVFIVTTAVYGKKINEAFFNALKTYRDARKGMIILTACADAKGTREQFKASFDPRLKECRFALRDLKLNERVMICDVQQSAKQQNPIGAWEKLTSYHDSSVILAGCKQALKYVPTYREKMPHALMTPGAVTECDFNNVYFMSKRTAKKAELDYQTGALIIEIVDSHKFHVRQVQSNADGSFTDLRTRYYPDGRIEPVYEATLVMGDSHVNAADIELTKSIREGLVRDGFVDTVVFHDLCNGTSVNPHEENDFLRLAEKYNDGSYVLMNEVNSIVEYINSWTYLGINVVVVNSNHDNFVERYVRSQKHVLRHDTANFSIINDLTYYYNRGEVDCALKWLVENRADIKLQNPEKVKWLKEDESYIKYGTELGFHGHRGANGAKGSLKTFENALKSAVLGHSHSGAIKCKIFQVGTTSYLDQGYNKGLSSWTRTCCLVHADGTKQLINFIPTDNGGYTYHV